MFYVIIYVNITTEYIIIKGIDWFMVFSCFSSPKKPYLSLQFKKNPISGYEKKNKRK